MCDYTFLEPPLDWYFFLVWVVDLDVGLGVGLVGDRSRGLLVRTGARGFLVGVTGARGFFVGVSGLGFLVGSVA